MIYEPRNNSWTLGPPMSTARDHVASFSSDDKSSLFVIGGRKTPLPIPRTRYHPWANSPSDDIEVFSIATGSWTTLGYLPLARGAISVAEYHRPGVGRSLLLVGGERFIGLSGTAYSNVEEYDPRNGLFYCHPPLPYAQYGGAAGVDEAGVVHVVGGAEWFSISATRRLQLYDLAAAPLPRQCMYEHRANLQDWWLFAAPMSVPYCGLGDQSCLRSETVPQVYVKAFREMRREASGVPRANRKAAMHKHHNHVAQQHEHRHACMNRTSLSFERCSNNGWSDARTLCYLVQNPDVLQCGGCKRSFPRCSKAQLEHARCHYQMQVVNSGERRVSDCSAQLVRIITMHALELVRLHVQPHSSIQSVHDTARRAELSFMSAFAWGTLESWFSEFSAPGDNEK